MNVYAIHKENPFTTEHNVKICSSKKLAEKLVNKLNEDYKKWRKEKDRLYRDTFCSTEYMDFVYSNPTPFKYRFEKLEVIKNEI